jgi:hypothetical protein
MAGSAGYSRKGTYPKRAPLIILRLARLDFAEGVLNGPTRSLDASAIDGAVVRVERQAVQCSVELVGNRSDAGPGLAEPARPAGFVRNERVLGGARFGRHVQGRGAEQVGRTVSLTGNRTVRRQ